MHLWLFLKMAFSHLSMSVVKMYLVLSQEMFISKLPVLKSLQNTVSYPKSEAGSVKL